MRIKIAVVVSLWSVFVFGQGLQLPLNVQSPNASSLGKYGDVPVSFYTGTPDVSIPIYKMKQSGVELDISLSYNASGVSVSDVPGWVGQNWSLNAGGVITRQINDAADEFNATFASFVPNYKGYFYPICHQRLNVPNWADLEYLEDVYESNQAQNDLTTYKEAEPDIFTFNFMGHTGKFFLGEDGQWKVASESNLKIEILESDFIYPFGYLYNQDGTGSINQSKVIGKILITDDKGITYKFGGSGTSIEYSKDFMNQATELWYANSWYLTEVKNHLGQALFTLDYIRDTGTNYTASFYNYQDWNQFIATYDGNGILSFNNGSCGSAYGSGIYGSGTPAIGGSLISPVFLSKITSLSNEIINFTSTFSQSIYYQSAYTNDVTDYISQLLNNNSPLTTDSDVFWSLKPYSTISQIMPKLKYRKLTNISGGGINATFGYNEPNYGGQHEYRFNLNSIDFTNSKIYSFIYDRFDQLPKFLSKAIDHMGYFNGVPYPIPNTISGYMSHFSHRGTNADKVLVGSLKKIIYPTKGFTEFEFEPHSYSKYLKDDKTDLVSVSNSIIGGLRIKKIINNDGFGNLNIKEYKYVKDYNLNHSSTNNSGILSNLPKYWWDDWDMRGSEQGHLKTKSFSVNPMIPLSNYFGSHIGYSEVVEINGDNSYTIYKYSSNENTALRDEAYSASMNLDYSPYEKCNDKSLLRGKQLEELSYSNTDLLVKKITNSYSTNDPLATKYVKGTNVEGYTCGPTTAGFGFLTGNAYKIYYYDYDKINQKEITYLNGHEYKTENNYSFQYYPSLSTSKGDRFLNSVRTDTYLAFGEGGSINKQENYKYPFNFSSAIYDDLISRRLFSIIETDKLQNSELLSKEKLEYAYFTTIGSGATHLNPSKTYVSKGSNPLYETIIIDKYDFRQNIAQFHLPNGLYTSFSWCYNYRYPIVKIEGAELLNRSTLDSKTAEIQTLLGSTLSGWSSQLSNIILKLNSIRDSYPNHLVTTYTYNPSCGVVSSITQPNGETSYYEYDSLCRLKYVKDASGNILSRTDYNIKP